MSEMSPTSNPFRQNPLHSLTNHSLGKGASVFMLKGNDKKNSMIRRSKGMARLNLHRACDSSRLFEEERKNTRCEAPGVKGSEILGNVPCYT